VAGLIESGEIWLSTTKLDEKISVARACITNFLTTDEDIDYCLNRLQKNISPLLKNIK